MVSSNVTIVRYMSKSKGNGVVYAADQTVDGATELFRADKKTDLVTTLNSPLVPGGDDDGEVHGEESLP